MITSDIKSYPTYKDSGIEWLGEIPAHWVESSLKRIARIDNSGSYGEEPESSDCVLAVATTAQIDMEGHFAVDDMPLRGFSHKDADRFRCRLGDILVVKSSGSISNVISGKTGIVDANTPEFVFSNFLLRVIAHIQVANPRYLFLLLSSDLTRERVKRMVAGSTYPNLRVDEYTSALLPVPPLPEQRAIAAFLDRETAQIDALVTKKERLIELLQEKRTALISHAITKGLDPDAPLKDSGVEWLGEIPAHWEVKKLKYLLIEPLKYGANEPAVYTDHNLPRYIRITDIREDGTLRDDSFRSIPEEIAKPYLLVGGDILFARSGATVGKTFQYDPSWGKAAYAGYLIRARLNECAVESDFVEYFTQSQGYTNWLLSNFIQATIQNVSAERYATLSIPFPLLLEQRAIAAFLDHETVKIDALIAKVQEAINHLKELRTAFISAAVTGKIDVREAAA